MKGKNNMNQSKKIEELCECFSTDIRMPRKYHALEDRIEEMKADIIKKQHPKKKKKIAKMLDTIFDDFLEMNCIEDDEYFRYGFSLAVQIMSEAFTQRIE